VHCCFDNSGPVSLYGAAMRIIQAPRKRSTSKEKSEAKSSKPLTAPRIAPRNVPPAQNATKIRKESDASGYSERRSSVSGDYSALKSTPSFDLESADDLNPLGHRSRGKDREKVEKDVDIIHKSIELLARREHSVVELKQKLKTREYSEEKIQQALEQLVRDGLVCDERFTEAYVRHRTMRGFGPNKIATELNSKGVSGLLIEEYLDASSPHWLDLALNAYVKKFGEGAPTTYAEWTKRARFLQGRGFSSSIIQNVCPSIEFD